MDFTENGPSTSSDWLVESEEERSSDCVEESCEEENGNKEEDGTKDQTTSMGFTQSGPTSDWMLHSEAEGSSDCDEESSDSSTIVADVKNFNTQLIPPQILNRKLILLIDLDQTIIHMKKDKFYNKRGDLKHVNEGFKSYHIMIRPNILSVLESLTNYYEIHGITLREYEFAERIIHVIDPLKKIFTSPCITRYGKYNKLKVVETFYKSVFDLIVFVDDRKDVWGNSKSLVQVHPFIYFFEPDGYDAQVKKLHGEPVNLVVAGAQVVPLLFDDEPRLVYYNEEVDKESEICYVNRLYNHLLMIHAEFFEEYNKFGNRKISKCVARVNAMHNI